MGSRRPPLRKPRRIPVPNRAVKKWIESRSGSSSLMSSTMSSSRPSVRTVSHMPPKDAGSKDSNARKRTGVAGGPFRIQRSGRSNKAVPSSMTGSTMRLSGASPSILIPNIGTPSSSGLKRLRSSRRFKLGPPVVGFLANLVQRQDLDLQYAHAVAGRQVEARPRGARMAVEDMRDICRPITRPGCVPCADFVAPLKRTREDGGMPPGDQELDGLENRGLAAVVPANHEIHSGQVGQPVRLEPTVPAHCKRL